MKSFMYNKSTYEKDSIGISETCLSNQCKYKIMGMNDLSHCVYEAVQSVLQIPLSASTLLCTRLCFKKIATHYDFLCIFI